MKIESITLLFLVSLAALTVWMPDGHTRTWYIKSDQTGDAPTIQAAVDSASIGDTVLVGPGNFITGIETALHVYKDIFLMSEEGPRSTRLSPLHGTEGSTVIRLANLGPASCFIGFTVRGGYPWWGGAGGIEVVGSSSLIRDNIVRDNASQDTGGIACTGGGSPIIRKNLIYSNQGGVGAAIYVNNTAAVIDSNTIAYNEYFYNGEFTGAVHIDSDQPVTITNNIIVFNRNIYTEYDNTGVFCVSDMSDITFICNCVFGNIPFDYGGLCTDQTGINGNFSLDPQFCAAKPDSSGNFYLQSDSPCAPGNHPDGYQCGLIGRCPVGCGTTRAETKSWGEIKQRKF